MALLTDIIEGLKHSPADLLTPAYLELSVSGACNFSCTQCHQLHHISHERKNDWGAGARVIDASLALAALQDAASMAVEFIEICGRGEPTLHPKLPEIITAVKALGMRGGLLTNGSRLTDALIDSIAVSRFDVVSVSLYGTTQQSFQSVARPRQPTDLASILERISIARSRAPHTRFVATVCFQEDHLISIELLISMINSLSVDDFQFTVMRPYHDRQLIQISPTGQSTSNPMVPRFQQLLSSNMALPPSLRSFLERYVASPDVDTIESTYSRIPCYAGYWATFICDDATVRPCSNSSWVLGDLRRNSLREIWQGEEYRRFRETAATQMIETRAPLYRSYCTHCGWAHMQEKIHEARNSREDSGSFAQKGFSW